MLCYYQLFMEDKKKRIPSCVLKKSWQKNEWTSADHDQSHQRRKCHKGIQLFGQDHKTDPSSLACSHRTGKCIQYDQTLSGNIFLITILKLAFCQSNSVLKKAMTATWEYHKNTLMGTDVQIL